MDTFAAVEVGGVACRALIVEIGLDELIARLQMLLQIHRVPTDDGRHGAEEWAENREGVDGLDVC